MTRHVAIIGGGYSGTLQAISLLALTDVRVTLIERARLARGVAYSTRSADHLLNVAAARMSAFADKPSHFADWLATKGLGGPDSFAERRTYGAYLEEQLAGAQAAYGSRLTVVEGEATDVVQRDSREHILLASGEQLDADLVVLSVGNLPPAIPGAIDRAGLAAGVYVADPWAGSIVEGLTEADTVLLIGTGLTAVDAALLLDSGGFRGRTIALSRRGLLPRAHTGSHATPEAPALESRCTSLVRTVRTAAAAHGWRGAVDSLRPQTQRLWADASVAERSRFLRHLRPWWDVHRHRIAPEIASRLARMLDDGRLQVSAGRIVSVAARERDAAVDWCPRGSDARRQLVAARIVNCTGPQSDITRSADPLIRNLTRSGRIRPDPCRIGIDVDPNCRTVAGSGTINDRLLAIGPQTKGAWWEIVAVPDLRHQVRQVADAMATPDKGDLRLRREA